jgi:hypothetical protein
MSYQSVPAATTTTDDDENGQEKTRSSVVLSRGIHNSALILAILAGISRQHLLLFRLSPV